MCLCDRNDQFHVFVFVNALCFHVKTVMLCLCVWFLLLLLDSCFGVMDRNVLICVKSQSCFASCLCVCFALC